MDGCGGSAVPMAGGMAMWICVGLGKQGCSHPVRETEVLHDARHTLGISLVSFGIVLAKLHHSCSEEVDTFFCNFVCLVVAGFVLCLDKALLNHVFCGMAFDLRNGYGFHSFCCCKSVVLLPYVAIVL